MGKIKCMKCLGSGQQFTRALAAKEECSSFPDSDPRLQKEPQQQREQGCFFTCCKSRRSESHSLHLWLKPETASAAKGSGGGARRHCLARKSRPHSGTEWQATHDGRRCLAHYPKKKKKQWVSDAEPKLATEGRWGKESSGLRTGRISGFCGLGSRIALEGTSFFASRKRYN